MRDILKRPGKKRRPGRGEDSATPDASWAESRRRRRRFGGFGFVGPVLIICAVIAVLAAVDYSMNAGKIYRGVSAGEVDLGGQTPAQAEESINEEATGALREVSFGGPEEYDFTAEEMGVEYNVEATVEEAYTVGREGGIFQRISDRFRGMYGAVAVEPDVDFDSSRAQARVDEISSELNAEPQEAAVEINGPEVAVSESSEGYQVDSRATMENVNAAIDDMSGEVQIVGEVLRPEIVTGEAERAAERARGAMDGQLTLTGADEQWNVSPAAIGASLDISNAGGGLEVALDRQAMRQNLENVYATINQPAVEASYEVDGTNVSVAPSQEGLRIEGQELLDRIEGGVFGGQREYQVPISVQRPEMTTAQAEQMKPTDLLGEYSTNYLTYDDTPGRVQNLKIGSNAVDGQLVAPGEVFSFNALASQYEYKSGGVIVDGQVDEADGGGLCQVSSTLYMAANYAGLDVVDRHPHYAELPYIRPGFDATVWFGALDMQFRNNTDGYILIEETVNTRTGDVYSAIYGVPQDVEVEMNSRKVGETTDGDGNPITDWVTYQTVTRNGEVTFDGVLHEDRYEYLEPAED